VVTKTLGHQAESKAVGPSPSVVLRAGVDRNHTTFATCIANATARPYARSPDIAAEPFHDGFLVYDRHAFEVVGYGATIDEAMENLQEKTR
jgi:hypothetical protein